jgi:hypothetical protein
MKLIDSPSVQGGSRPLSLDDLGDRIIDMAGRLASATARWLSMVAEFDLREGYVQFGLASSAQWLTHRCGITHRTAVEHVRVGRSLLAHPRLTEEMSAGRLSYSQVRAISRLATPGEHILVDDLIEVARHGTVAQLEDLVRGLRTVDHNDNATDPGEYLNRSWTSDSRWRLSARLDPERGALVDAAVDAIVQRDGLSPTEALVRLAEIGLAAMADGKRPPRRLRGAERAAMVIHLDASRVPVPENVPPPDPGGTPEHVAPPVGTREPRSAERGRLACARVAGGAGLPDRVVQRLMCDGRVRTILHGSGSNVLDVGRSHRLVTDRQYRALLVRHHGRCAHPGCPNTKDLDAHHRIPWLQGGRTDLANLVLLCERHHLAQHAGEFQISSLGGGRFRFVTADGRDLSGSDQIGHGNVRRLEDEHAEVAPCAATPLWDGQRLDRRYAISVLAGRRQLAS